MSGSEVLVLGATGRFSALTGALIQRGHRVRAATRDLESERSVKLRAQGADMVRVDFDDPTSIEAAAQEADAVFAAGTAHAAGPAKDAAQGRAMIDALAAAGAGHLVFVSVAGADNPAEVPLLESKHEIEDHLRLRGLPFTIIAPVYLMENLWNPWNQPVLAARRFPSPVPAERKLQQIALADIISLAVHVLEHQQELLGERIEVASDELNALESAAIIAGLIQRPLEVEVNARRGPAPLFAWLDQSRYAIDIGALHRRFPEVGWHSYRDWTQTQDWSILAG
jgi:uncharacterized protein YbjT (DUF2867 family)